jgi:iron complex outermembrane receptor protein
MKRKARLTWGSAGAAWLIWAGAATPASSARVQDTANATTVGELVITAEKREQTLQTVPVAVSAYTAAERQLIGIDSIQEMTNFTPGLEYNSSTDRISLRGIGRMTNVLSADAAVANYSDGVYETFAAAAGTSTLFLDRVEILRGPQGTLYGRNAIGGAINEISRRPTQNWYAEGRVTYANYDHFILEGAISGPIGDHVQFRLAGNWEKQSDGWIKEVVPGVPDEGNVIDEFYLEAQLQAQFSDRFEGWIKLGFNEWNNGGGGPGAASGGWTPYPFQTAEAGNAALLLNPGYGCTGIPTNVVNPSPLGCFNPAQKSPWLAARAIPYRVRLPDAYLVASQWTYHLPGADIRYITGGARYNYILTGPNAGNISGSLAAPITSYTLPGGLVINPQAVFRYQELNAFWSHEINIVSNNNTPFQWLVGGYYFFQKFQQPVYSFDTQQPQLNGPFAAPAFFCAQTGGVCAPETQFRNYDDRAINSDRTEAVFGQIDWRFADRLKATLGLRYTHDRKYGSESVRLTCFAVPACLAAPEFDPFIPGGLTQVDLSQYGPVVDTGQDPGGLPMGIAGVTTYNPNTGFATRLDDGSWGAVTGTAGVEWTPDASTLVYGKFSRGYKSGGYNIGIVTTLAPKVEATNELVNAFEIGLKKTFFGALTTDVAAFYYAYDDLQIPILVVDTSGQIARGSIQFYNVPTSISRGVELETTWRPNRSLTLLFNYSFLDAYITKGQAVDAADPAALDPHARPIPCSATSPCTADIYTVGLPGGGFQRNQNLAGNRLPNSPRNKIAINATYTFDFRPGSLSVGVSYIWRDVQYGQLFTRPYNAAPAWDEWDARLIWTAASGRYKVIVFGKNLRNTIGYDAGATGTRLAGVSDGATFPYTPVAFIQDPGVVKTFSVTPPRTYGIEFDYRFF